MIVYYDSAAILQVRTSFTVIDNNFVKISNNHGNILIIMNTNALKRGEQIRLETLVVHALNNNKYK